MTHSRPRTGPHGHPNWHMHGFPLPVMAKKIINGIFDEMEGGFPMPYSLKESDSEYVITLPLPGHAVEDIEVSVKGSELLIETTDDDSEEGEDQEKIDYRTVVSMAEFIWNKPNVHLKIPLPDAIEPDSIKASYKKGILSIRVMKKPGQKVNIDVQGSD